MNEAALSDERREPSLKTLLGRIRRLELIARRNAFGPLASDYRTAIPGRGMLFHEARKYVSGESARSIDWNITARVGEPYVKVHLEERQRDVWIAVDVSPSMHMGSREKTKLEAAVELAATLAVSAVEGGDRVGYLLFADRVLARGRPRGGRVQLHRTLSALLEHTRPWNRPIAVSDPRCAVHALESVRRGRFVVFLISDFIDHDVPDDLRYLRPRHDVSLLHVYDPLEYGAPAQHVRLRAAAPEGERRAAVLSPGHGESLEEMTGFLSRAAARYRLDFASVSTAEPVGRALGRFFHRKRRRAG